MSAATVSAALPAAERGRLRIADRVLVRLAERAAGQALGRSGAVRRIAVTGPGDPVRLTLGVELPFPADLAALATAVRAAVAAELAALTGRTVGEVVVVVERLVPTV
ncbi:MULTISPECIES: iron-sulfur cluster assembly protein [unclassified Kitasatospora]|uniref:iron-sulfur cluster assembly protein n=1 Tax=unclassified Kitasatospora TaxID=2633591 RepID=UPI00071039D0|nr:MULTISPECIES: iron-sulfur cluster assembly protein [unclassified Kitasatospora]KQV03257.1 hypothetical protein ASC99_15660 [Kitasatospora sp. Root107]KRB66159.1 hypothetical protein ASE03_31805 [Kitasatospora sp. Root187]